MKPKHSRLLVIVGMVLMVAGALDPLEGSVVIVLGSALAAAGAFFARAHRYRLQLTAFVLIAVGVAAMFGLSALGGVGGSTGRRPPILRHFGVSARRVVPVPRRSFPFPFPTDVAIISRSQGSYPRGREGWS
jgi:hypothetical protein